MLSVLFDIVAVIILIYMVARGAKHGFAGTLVSFLGYVLSFSVSMFISETLSAFAFQQFFRENIIETLSAQLNTTDLAGSLQNFVATLPGYVSNAVNAAGLSIEGLNGSVQNIAVTFVDTTIAPIIINMIRSVLFCILFAVCMFLVQRLKRSMRFFNRIPLLGPFNYFLGGVLGFVQGVIVLLIIALIATILLWFFQAESTAVIYAAIDQSFLVKYLFWLR